MRFTIPLFLILLTCSCKKFLDEKPDKKLAVPGQLAELQAMLDYSRTMNQYDPSIGEMSADNYWISDVNLAALAEQDVHVYTWQENMYYGSFPNDWGRAFSPVYYSNIVLETIAGIDRTPDNTSDWNNVAGSAHFFRGKTWLDIASIWCKAYDPTTAKADLGLPLHYSSDFNAPSVRTDLEKTYNAIISELKAAASLLPDKAVHVMRPSKAAAYGYLARCYLFLQQYDSSYTYAGLTLDIDSTLEDYNLVVPASSSYSFDRFGREVIFHSTMVTNYANLSNSILNIDSNLYRSYSPDDLRKKLFFRSRGDGSYSFRGSYANRNLFSGLAVDEVYLMRAEAAVKLGLLNEGLDYLNKLLASRMVPGAFTPINTQDAQEALAIIRQERRKELLLRGTRWPDIKRWNEEGAGIALQRVVNGHVFSLLPGANHFALPIPPDIIALSGMEQNPQ